MLLAGLSYILLRQYLRFVILLILLFFIPYIEFLVILGSAFDAYFIAKKIKSKEMSVPKFNIYFAIFAYVIWAASILIFIYAVFIASQIGIF
jgi:hypothetical protein